MAISIESADGVTNGATPVDIIAAPASGVTISVPPAGISIHNSTGSAVVVTLQLDVSATDRIIEVVSVATGATFFNTGPIHLDATTTKIEAVLGGAGAIPFVANYLQKS